MSELNNNEDILKKYEGFDKNNKIFTKPTIIFLVIFIIISIAITSGAIYFKLTDKKSPDTNIAKDSTEESKIEKIHNTVAGIKNYTDTYNENDLEIITIHMESSNPKVDEYSSYIKISGLKNKSIENMINEDIENSAHALSNLHPDAKSISIYSTVSANFSDVLSIVIYSTYVYSGNNYEYEDIYLNYRLDTGEKFEFTDLFIDSANIKSILSQSIYTNLIWEFAMKNGNFDSLNDIDLKSKDYGYIEDEVFKYLSIYMREGISSFYFSPKSITFILNDETFYMGMPDFYKDIAIYNRFKSKTSLYEKSNIGNKNLFVFMDNYRGDLSVFTSYSDNMFVDLFYLLQTYGDSSQLSEADLNNIILKVEDYLEECKKKADSNPNKAYCYIAMVMTDKDKYGNIDIHMNISEYEMSKDFYDSEFKLMLAKSYAYYISGGGLDHIYLSNQNIKETANDYIDLSIRVTSPSPEDEINIEDIFDFEEIQPEESN